MKLKQVGINGFRSYGSETIFDLDDGLTAIVGHNGSGKSSILSAVVWCLFGVTPTTQAELFHRGAVDIAVRVTFEHGSKTYSATRLLHAQASGGTVPKLELQELSHTDSDDNTWVAVDLTGATIRETTATLASIVGDWDVASATWFCGQDDGGRVLQATPAQRRDLLSAALGIDERWDRMHTDARNELNALETVIDKIETGREIRQEKAEELPDARKQLTAYEIDEEATRNVLTAAANAASQATEAYMLLKGKQETYNSETERLQGLQAREERLGKAVDLVTEELAGVNRTIHTRKATETAYADAVRAVQERDEERSGLLTASIEVGRVLDAARKRVARRRNLSSRSAYMGGEISDLSDRLDELRKSDVCPTCGELPSTNEGREKLGSDIGNLASQVGEASKRLATFGTASHYHDLAVEAEATADNIAETAHISVPDRLLIPDAVDREHERLQNALALQPQLTTRLKELDVELKSTTDELAEFDEIAVVDPQEVANLWSKEKEANSNRDRARNEYDAATAARIRQQEQVAMLENSVSSIEEIDKDLVEKRATLSTLELAVEALSPRGARQLILDQALMSIESEANVLLNLLRPGTHVTFSTVAESGRETLDIFVLDESGMRSWESFSGGEKTRVMFAVRVAMAHAAATAHGLHSLPAFVFDEAFGDQDEEGRAALISALHMLAGQVEQVIAITHDSDLLGRVDNVIRLEKVDGSTTIQRA